MYIARDGCSLSGTGQKILRPLRQVKMEERTQQLEMGESPEHFTNSLLLAESLSSAYLKKK